MLLPFRVLQNGILLIVLSAIPSFSANAACGFINIGNHQLYHCLQGQGSQVVVLEAGMRNDSRSWGSVADSVATFATVLTYDRAGLGQSEPGLRPRTSLQIAKELKNLLDQLAVPSPYLLVGHSAGGWHMRAFVHAYPEKVSGLILVDSPHEAFEAARWALLNETEQEERQALLDASRATLPEPIQQEYAGIALSRPVYATFRFPSTLPLVVLAAENHTWLPPRTAQAQEEVWWDLQHQLADLSDRGTLVLVEGSGHNMPAERPDAIVETIRALLIPTTLPRDE